MIESGYMKIYRSLFDSDLWLDKPFSRGQAWMDLLGMAAYKDTILRVRGKRIVLKRGQVCFSERYLSKRWGWSRSKVSRFIQELSGERATQNENEAKIEPLKTPQGEPLNERVSSVFVIINYNKYQGGEPLDEPQREPHKSHCPPETEPLPYIKNKSTVQRKIKINKTNAYACAHEGETTVTDIYKAAFEYLNDRLKTNFPYGDLHCRRWINHWTIERDYTLEDLKKTVDKCIDAWRDNAEMCRSLRPSIIWGRKFPEYLNLVTPSKTEQKGQHGYDISKHTPSTSTDPNYWLGRRTASGSQEVAAAEHREFTGHTD